MKLPPSNHFLKVLGEKSLKFSLKHFFKASGFVITFSLWVYDILWHSFVRPWIDKERAKKIGECRTDSVKHLLKQVTKRVDSGATLLESVRSANKIRAKGL